MKKAIRLTNAETYLFGSPTASGEEMRHRMLDTVKALGEGYYEVLTASGEFIACYRINASGEVA